MSTKIFQWGLKLCDAERFGNVNVVLYVDEDKQSLQYHGFHFSSFMKLAKMR